MSKKPKNKMKIAFYVLAAFTFLCACCLVGILNSEKPIEEKPGPMRVDNCPCHSASELIA